MRGFWRPEQLQRLLTHQVEPGLLTPPIKWQDLPVQIPHAIELHLGADDFLYLFPYRIRFLQFTKSQDFESAREIVRMEMNEVTRLDNVDESLFVIRSQDAWPNDLTEGFAHRLREMSRIERTAESSLPDGARNQ